MGHLINPISNRLSINTFWNSNWALVNSFNYINLFKKDYILFQFLNWFLKKSNFSKSNVIVSHYKIFRLYKKIFINFYYYNAPLQEKKYKYQAFSILNLLRRRKKFLFWNKRKRKKNILYNTKGIIHTRFVQLVARKTKTGRFNFRKKIFTFTMPRNKLSKIKIKKLFKYFVKIILFNIFWCLFRESISFYLGKLNKNFKNFYFNIFSLDFLSVTSEIVSTYIALRLQQRYSLNWVLKPVLKDLTMKTKKNFFSGYKIVCSGRFTRKQIATYIWMKQGALRFNNFSNLIRYSESTVKLKYGICGIKVWLNYGFNDETLRRRYLLLVYPKYTPFKYIFNLKKKILTISLNYWFYLYLRVCFIKTYSLFFYKFFIKLKTRVLIFCLIKKIFKTFINRNFKLIYNMNNKLILKMSTQKMIRYNSFSNLDINKL